MLIHFVCHTGLLTLHNENIVGPQVHGSSFDLATYLLSLSPLSKKLNKHWKPAFSYNLALTLESPLKFGLSRFVKVSCLKNIRNVSHARILVKRQI